MAEVPCARWPAEPRHTLLCYLAQLSQQAGQIPVFVLKRLCLLLQEPQRFLALLSHAPKKAVPCSHFPQPSSPGRTALPGPAVHLQGKPPLWLLLLLLEEAVVFTSTAGVILSSE